MKEFCQRTLDTNKSTNPKLIPLTKDTLFGIFGFINKSKKVKNNM